MGKAVLPGALDASSQKLWGVQASATSLPTPRRSALVGCTDRLAEAVTAWLRSWELPVQVDTIRSVEHQWFPADPKAQMHLMSMRVSCQDNIPRLVVPLLTVGGLRQVAVYVAPSPGSAGEAVDQPLGPPEHVVELEWPESWVPPATVAATLYAALRELDLLPAVHSDTALPDAAPYRLTFTAGASGP